MVLSRELSLMQVESIAKEIKRRQITGPSGELVRLEVFGHGALCMAVSGKCYLSLHSNFSSANRGACIQNCRKSYIVTDKDTGQELEIQNEYIMSAKDLCTINFLDKIIDAGVAVLKIEGRGRSADYVFKTIKCYREAIDSIQEDSYTQEKIDAWMTELSTVFNRGFWDGYYLGRLMGEWNDEYGSKATKRKIYVAKGITHYAKSRVAEFLMEAHDVKPGDEVLIIGPTTGVIEYTLPELFVDGQQAEKGQKGERITFKIDEKIRPSDKLYKWVDA
jgi:putative protease